MNADILESGSVLPNDERSMAKVEPWTLYVPDELKGPFVHTGRPRRIGDLLKEITSEAMITRDGGTYVTRLEIIMRYVVEQAQLGNLWCIQFLAERMEGKAVAVIESHSTTGDVRDIPTDQLIDALGAENVEGDLKLRFESAVDAEVRRRLAMIQAAEHMRLPAESVTVTQRKSPGGRGAGAPKRGRGRPAKKSQ